MRSDDAAPRLPPIRRARGFRLYDVSGRRYLDLSRDGALLGHRAESTLTVMKSVISQGLVSALPSIWERRLLAAVARLVPGFAELRLYASSERALAAVRRHVGEDLGPTDLHDPARSAPARKAVRAALWRPFVEVPAARALLVVLPTRVGGAPVPVCFDTEAARGVPASDVVPGFILAGALRGLLALGREAGPDACPLGGPRLARAIDGAPGWARVGPYVTAAFAAADYPRVHEEFLDEGVYLFPAYSGPSVLPGDCSLGEERLLAELFSRIPGG